MKRAIETKEEMGDYIRSYSESQFNKCHTTPKVRGREREKEIERGRKREIRQMSRKYMCTCTCSSTLCMYMWKEELQKLRNVIFKLFLG